MENILVDAEELQKAADALGACPEARIIRDIAEDYDLTNMAKVLDRISRFGGERLKAFKAIRKVQS